jgi:hypothetical protein
MVDGYDVLEALCIKRKKKLLNISLENLENVHISAKMAIF